MDFRRKKGVFSYIVGQMRVACMMVFLVGEKRFHFVGKLVSANSRPSCRNTSRQLFLVEVSSCVLPHFKRLPYYCNFQVQNILE